MKGLIFDIKRFAVHDGPGIRQTVFFKGCPLNCSWCHNPESRSDTPEYLTTRNKIGKQKYERKEFLGEWMESENVMQKILKDRIFYDESDGGVTFSGGEPLLQIPFLTELLTSCDSEYIHTTVDTCGYAPWEDFKKILPYTKLFLFDIKHLDNNVHQEITGVSNHLIIENLIKLQDFKTNLIVRIPVISGINDSEADLKSFIDFFSENLKKGTEINLLPYHQTAHGKFKDLYPGKKVPDFEAPDLDRINEMKFAFEKTGFKVKIGG